MTGAVLSESLRLSLAEAVTQYHGSVDEVAAYLAARGITKAAAEHHLLGYVTEDNVAVGHEQFIGRMSLPYITPTGVVDVRFRAVTEEQAPKYLSRAGSEHILYNVMAFRQQSDYIAICEGEIDCITASTLCNIPAVALQGTSAWKPFYARAFQDYERVLVLCDGDQPGKELGKKIATSVDQAVVIHMPDGQDVNSTYLAEGVDGIRRRAGV